MELRLSAVCLLIPLPVFAFGNGKLEQDYQVKWCQGQNEVVLEDKTRVDCLTYTHAIEVEFASKWKNSIGQSLHYALMTGKKAGIALILRKESDQRYLDQLNRVIAANELPIQVWQIHNRAVQIKSP